MFFICIWLYALFISAIEKIAPLILVKIFWIGSMVQLHLVSSIIVFSCRASKTILSDSLFLRMITGLMNVFPVVRESVFTDAIMSKCVNISSKCCIFSCNWSGMRVALCFLKMALAFRGDLVLP